MGVFDEFAKKELEAIERRKADAAAADNAETERARTRAEHRARDLRAVVDPLLAAAKRELASLDIVLEEVPAPADRQNRDILTRTFFLKKRVGDNSKCPNYRLEVTAEDRIVGSRTLPPPFVGQPPRREEILEAEVGRFSEKQAEDFIKKAIADFWGVNG